MAFHPFGGARYLGMCVCVYVFLFPVGDATSLVALLVGETHVS